MKQRMQSQKMIFQIIESTKALGDYNIQTKITTSQIKKKS